MEHPLDGRLLSFYRYLRPLTQEGRINDNVVLIRSNCKIRGIKNYIYVRIDNWCVKYKLELPEKKHNDLNRKQITKLWKNCMC